MLNFLLKQKTAYEMRISDWSSDVCSSDLLDCSCAISLRSMRRARTAPASPASPARSTGRMDMMSRSPTCACWRAIIGLSSSSNAYSMPARNFRSEEHTSELQSLMRISYAVFCLKKKKQTTQVEHLTLVPLNSY